MGRTEERGIVVFTQFGRIEFDPMSVPLAKSGANTAGSSFADRLDQVNRRAEPEFVRDEPKAHASEPECETPCEAPHADEPTEEVTTTEVARQELPTDASAAPVAVPNEPVISRESPTRRDDAGEGVGVSLEPSSGKSSLPLSKAAAKSTTASAVAAPAAFVLQPLEAVQQAKATVRAEVDRLVGVEGSAPARATSAASAASGYRTRNAFAVQLDEQARDSVFKQILFKLGKEGSEMRVRLEPPELGELDLHLTVDAANSLRLSITTERSDLRDLLRDGLQQLEQDLQATGLKIAHTEVNARDGREPRQPLDFGTAAGGSTNDAESEAPAAAVRSGWVSANGLDFWV